MIKKNRRSLITPQAPLVTDMDALSYIRYRPWADACISAIDTDRIARRYARAVYREEQDRLKELEAKNAKFIHFCVSDAQKAAKIIAATFHSKDFRLTDANNLYLYDMTLPVEKINRSFVESGIEIQEVHLCEDTLEDYFKKITGGEGIA